MSGFRSWVEIESADSFNMNTNTSQQSQQPPTKKLRQACDRCHLAKSKCQSSSRGTKCLSCSESGEECVYSVQNRAGRPKGARNKKSLGQASGKRHATASISSSLSAEFDELASQLEQPPPTPQLAQPQSLLSDSSTGFNNVLNEVPSKTQSLDDLSIPADSNELWDFFYHNLPPTEMDQRQKGAFAVS